MSDNVVKLLSAHIAAPDLNVCKINIKYMMHCIICFHNTIHVVCFTE